MSDRNRKNTDKILEIIKEIEDLVEKSKPSPLSQTKIVVSREDLLSLIRELRMKTPSEIERYRKMLENRDAIIEDAERKAERMLEEARMNIQNLVDENEIVQQALYEADKIMEDANYQRDEMLRQAEREAQMIHRGAMKYMAENLTKLQNIIDGTMNSFDGRFRSMMTTMERYSELVRENKDELLGRNQEPQIPQEQPVPQPVEAQPEAYPEEYPEEGYGEEGYEDEDFDPGQIEVDPEDYE